MLLNQPWNRLPSSGWLKTLDGFVQQTQRVVLQYSFQLVVERSSGSEARYLHILRDRTWFGIRFAAHYPVYRCSKDYFQVLLDDPPTDQAIQYTIRQVNDLILGNLQVVADPVEVELELQRQANLRLSVREVADLRHRLNQRAKWVWEVENGC